MRRADKTRCLRVLLSARDEAAAIRAALESVRATLGDAIADEAEALLLRLDKVLSSCVGDVGIEDEEDEPRTAAQQAADARAATPVAVAPAVAPAPKAP